MTVKRTILATVGGVLMCLDVAAAGPWAEVGDADLRSDILILASAGVIDDVTMQWPLPWTGILRRLSISTALDDQPDYVREAAQRVQDRGLAAVNTRRLMPVLSVDAASEPALVRDFSAMSRGAFESTLAVTALWDSTALNLSVGGRTVGYGDHQALMFDDSYIAQRIGNAVVTIGYKTHWWGPGWVSALSLSNNARPMPQIGISRLDTKPFESPWLSWLGPWQAEFFVGLMDGPRAVRNVVYTGFRVGISPLPHLEIGFARTTMMCGDDSGCKPIADYFDILNDENNVNRTNDQGNIDIRYSYAFRDFAFETYFQFMNEDTNPFHHSGSSHLYGAGVWMPLWNDGTGRLTVEYADTVPTMDLWGSGTLHGVAYNNNGFPTGARYRGRSLGFSLDSDSRLLSVQTSYRRNAGDSYTLSYHHAEISSGELVALTASGSVWHNAVSTEPVTINLLEGRVEMPFDSEYGALRVSLAGRVQDDRPRPEKGWLSSVELRLSFAL